MDDRIEEIEAINGAEQLAASAKNVASVRQDAENAKQAQLDFQKVNVLAALRAAIMCKLVYEVAKEREDEDPHGFKYARLLLSSALVTLRHYPDGAKLYREAMKLDTIATDIAAYKVVFNKLAEADAQGHAILLDL